MLHDLGVSVIQCSSGNRSPSCTLGHQDHVSRPGFAPGGDVRGNPYCTDTACHAGTEHHVTPDTERGTGDQRDSHRLPYRTDPCSIVKYLGHVTAVCHVNVREEEDRTGAHDIDIPHRGSRDMEPCEKWKIREPRMHPVHRADDFEFRVALDTRHPGDRDHTPIVHLVHPNRGPGMPNDPGNLPVGKEIACTPGTDAKLPHAYPGLPVREEVA